jgi:hypothetical protein
MNIFGFGVASDELLFHCFGHFEFVQFWELVFYCSSNFLIQHKNIRVIQFLVIFCDIETKGSSFDCKDGVFVREYAFIRRVILLLKLMRRSFTLEKKKHQIEMVMHSILRDFLTLVNCQLYTFVSRNFRLFRWARVKRSSLSCKERSINWIITANRW